MGRGTKYTKWIAALVRDLQQHKGSSLVVAGDYQSPAVHALAHAMNDALGNVGKTVVYTTPLQSEPVESMASLREVGQRYGSREGRDVDHSRWESSIFRSSRSSLYRAS